MLPQGWVRRGDEGGGGIRLERPRSVRVIRGFGCDWIVEVDEEVGWRREVSWVVSMFTRTSVCGAVSDA